MTWIFRKALRENVNLLIGVSGGTGSGKTYSALRLATGISGDRPFALIDTERGRARHYADRFRFDVVDLEAPFSPARYSEAIRAADEAGYPCIVVDSASHSWTGEGGAMDMQELEFSRLGGRDSSKLLSWSRPKQELKRMVGTLLTVKAHVILCLRAEEKIEMVKDPSTGKTVVRPKASLTSVLGWIPICEKTLPFELTLSALLMPDRPGVPHWIKLQEQHRTMFTDGVPLDETAGKRLAEWARGGSAPQPAAEMPAKAPETVQEPRESIHLDDWTLLLKEAGKDDLRDLWTDCAKACKTAGDMTAYAALQSVKDERKRELGLR